MPPAALSMRYDPVNSAFFSRTRERLARLLKPGSLAVLHANDVLPTNADGVLPFKQNTNLYYLSGIDQEETILMLFPEAHEEKERVILYIRETSDKIRVWDGDKLTLEAASRLSGIENTKWTSAFADDFARLAKQAEHIYLETNEHARAENPVPTRNDRFIPWCQERFPLHRYERLAPLLARLRALKAPEEIKMITQALAITKAGLDRVLETLGPGMGEWEIEATLAYEFIRRRSRGFAFPPIVANGPNACCLHYVENNQRCQSGDLVLIDAGAEWGHWNADLTRTYPVDGRFTARQRAVYDAVLRTQRYAMSILRPGKTLKEYDYEVKGYAAEELARLGALSSEQIKERTQDEDPVRKYFMHGTSHHLGLDVHDVSPPHEPIREGMVFTVEPGFYLPEEGIGVRLENNVLVTPDGVQDLSAQVPVEADEIEASMAKAKQ